MDLLRREVPASSLVVAIDPGKAFNRVWLTSGERGLIGEPVSLPVLRDGVDELERLIATSGVSGRPVIGLEATGSLHRAWATEIERRWPGSLRMFAPSETTAARGQLGARRFKTDDRAGWFARAPVAPPSRTSSTRCKAPFAIAASSSTRAGSSSSACTISSTRSARVCRRRPVTAASSTSPRRPVKPSWPARSRSAAGHHRRGRC
jgi:hypothetical protein